MNCMGQSRPTPKMVHFFLLSSRIFPYRSPATTSKSDADNIRRANKILDRVTIMTRAPRLSDIFVRPTRSNEK